jgi:hypothetical protein
MTAAMSSINSSTNHRNSKHLYQIQHRTSFVANLLMSFDSLKIKSNRASENDRLHLLYQTSYKTSQTNQILSIDSSKLGNRSNLH